jgi:hypothetical protein
MEPGRELRAGHVTAVSRCWGKRSSQPLRQQRSSRSSDGQSWPPKRTTRAARALVWRAPEEDGAVALEGEGVPSSESVSSARESLERIMCLRGRRPRQAPVRGPGKGAVNRCAAADRSLGQARKQSYGMAVEPSWHLGGIRKPTRSNDLSGSRWGECALPWVFVRTRGSAR